MRLVLLGKSLYRLAEISFGAGLLSYWFRNDIPSLTKLVVGIIVVLLYAVAFITIPKEEGIKNGWSNSFYVNGSNRGYNFKLRWSMAWASQEKTFSSLIYLQKQPLQILAFGMVDVDRMIEGMRGFFDDLDISGSIFGGTEDDFLEEIRFNERRTRRGK